MRCLLKTRNLSQPQNLKILERLNGPSTNSQLLIANSPLSEFSNPLDALPFPAYRLAPPRNGSTGYSERTLHSLQGRNGTQCRYTQHVRGTLKTS